jgi:alpha-beta hydrolase superfamily lysophospholipase
MTSPAPLSRTLSMLQGPHGRLASMAVNCQPDNKARIIMAHGFSASAGMVEHAKLFAEMAERLADLGFGSVLFDFTGNGLSDGVFSDMTPNRRIDEAVFMIDHVASDYAGPLFLLGLSMGGAVSIHAASKRADRLKGLVTWSCVPSFELGVPSAHWYPEKADPEQCESPGPAFYTDRPAQSIASAYKSLTLPKLQIQGDQDFAFFAEEFKVFFDEAREPKKLVLLKGGDHVFINRSVRTAVISETRNWLAELID